MGGTGKVRKIFYTSAAIQCEEATRVGKHSLGNSREPQRCQCVTLHEAVPTVSEYRWVDSGAFVLVKGVWSCPDMTGHQQVPFKSHMVLLEGLLLANVETM